MNQKFFSYLEFIIFCVSLAATSQASANPSQCLEIFRAKSSIPVGETVNTYLEDTLNSLEIMRGENGLLLDTIWVQSAKEKKIKTKALNSNTSPTNIAIDLLIQAERNNDTRVTDILTEVEKLEFHKDTGLLFSWYGTARGSAVKNKNVSSIDNLHLALALWTIKENFPNSVNGARAKQLFDRMDFSVYYDPQAALIGGNLRYNNGVWVREAYNLSNLGSEGRILYSVGWALGLYRSYTQDQKFLENAMAALSAEVYRSPEGDLLKLWDGAAFQLFFPKIFANEENYSSKMRGIYESMGDYIIAEGGRRGLPTPAAHSAGRVSVIDYRQAPSYRDKSGNRELISSSNQDIMDPFLNKNWDSTFSPNVMFMAGTANPSKFIPVMRDLQNLGVTERPLYSPAIGWLDGLHVQGPAKGEVVPVQLALNQGMIALSLLQMQAADGMGVSGRALFNNPETNARLLQFYILLENKLESAQ